MAANIAGVLENNLQNLINDSNVLVVGAGGIGCEILKNLVLTGFKNIEIIDLDTIDVSNLNRQFLFHKQHVGKSKAEVAKESVLKFNPDVHIKAHHDSIINVNYGINYFKQFSLVLNALDNLSARNHVNRMCLASNVPLIESGTAGYEGQVELIVKGKTKCYECYPKAPQKSFPGCTIRNTPSEPIHCIVWSKHLFNQLFGEEDADQDVSPDTADPEASGTAGDKAANTEGNASGNVDRVSTREWARSSDYNAEKLFTKLFNDDIEYLLSMSDLWKTRQKPKPLKWSEIPKMDTESKNKAASCKSLLKDQRSWSLKECVDIFVNSCQSLSKRFKELPEDDHLVWDKDDQDSMDFVAACSNIRAHIFNIQQKTRFEIKSMAGNIIPAIATTNAVVAGLVVLFAMNVLQEQFEKCPCVYVRSRPNHRKQQIVPEKFLDAPLSTCYVCSAKPMVTIGVDLSKLTVETFVNEVLKKKLNMVAPDVLLVSTGAIIISSEEDEMNNSNQTLQACGIIDGSLLEVDDFLQEYKLTIHVAQREIPRDGPDFVVTADPNTLKPKEEEKSDAENGKNENEDPDDDDLIMTFDDQDSDKLSTANEKKRKSIPPEIPYKKRKTESSNDDESDDVVMIE